ncbi:MAG TPA: hypothetical protein VD862_01355 [Candidatus Paceibacterota bacterium]|nr:hypothetical protein [Candidatus Paceibacterota bacterium]
MAQPPATTDIVPVKNILERMVFLKDGTLRSVIEVSAVNFDLRSSDEQAALIQQFQGFLNAVDFRMQILIQSRRYDIEQYMQVVEKATDALDNDMLKVQGEEYMRFVRELSDLSNIMSKRFLVVIPLEATVAKDAKSMLGDLKGMFGKKKAAPAPAGPTEEQMQAWQMQLAQRADLVISGLAGMGLRGRLLEQEELVTLYTSLFNPEVPSVKTS